MRRRRSILCGSAEIAGHFGRLQAEIAEKWAHRRSQGEKWQSESWAVHHDSLRNFLVSYFCFSQTEVYRVAIAYRRQKRRDTIIFTNSLLPPLPCHYQNYDAIIVRSDTKITADVLESGSTGRLKVVGRAGVGIDNIDTEAATKHKIIVLK